MTYKPRKTRIAIFLLIFFSVSCSVIEDYDLKYDGDRLVINGFLVNGQPLRVNISRSQAPTGVISNDLKVEGARVILYEDGEILTELLEVDKGVYQTDHVPVDLVEYRLEVYADNYPAAVSDMETMPTPFLLSDLSYSRKETVLSGSKPGFEVKFILKDPQDMADYYELVVSGFHPSTGYVPLRIAVNGDSHIGNVPCTFYTEYQSVIIEDSCFDGEKYPIRLEFEESKRRLINNQSVEIRFEKFVVSLRKISENYYRYRETSIIPWKIEYVFFEPKMLHSNINGGYGIFGSWNETKIEILN